jgi:2-oxoglutarate/2-oxoacid ferredoxin oxidoreductase subunit alpha
MAIETTSSSLERRVHSVEHVVVRFCGDSGDGMQLTGSEFTKVAAADGNDIATFPDFPAEIRAPAGSLAGVSGFQLHFSSSEIFTPGDAPDVLVAMNPAALKTNIADLPIGGTLIVNTGTFIDANLAKAGYEADPLADPELYQKFKVHKIDITKLTNAALADTGLSPKEKARCKNFFALGLMFWVYSKDLDGELRYIKQKFAKDARLADANMLALKAGYHYGETAEMFQDVYEVKPAKFAPGIYRNITGNEALALGLTVAGELAGKPIFYSGYPITPASSLLHYLAHYKNYGVVTLQVEDEIAGIGAAIGASFGGAIGVTASSGPGISLKGEGMALAVMTEVPLVVVSVQRGGPSTGLPTKTEQSDLLQSLFGRNGECPMPIIAAATPADAFECAIEAVKVATRYVTPVILLSDGYLANGSEPWLLPDVTKLERFPVEHRTDPTNYQAYARDPETLARAWVVPGTPGMEHRIGGLEKHALTGNVSYDAVNHERMVRIRAEKVERIARECGPLNLFGDEEGDLLVIGWGCTFGALRQAVGRSRDEGKKVSHVQLRWLNPLNPRLEPLLKGFKRVLVPELNMGQLRWVLRARYLVDAIGLNKIQGQPFKVGEVYRAIEDCLAGRQVG